MLSKISSALLLVVAIINFLPLIGIISAEQLSKLYGIPLDNENLIILLRHRALLFGLIGGVMIYSVFNIELRPLAYILGLISMLGFIFISYQTGSYNQELSRIVNIDITASLLLLIAIGLSIFAHRS